MPRLRWRGPDTQAVRTHGLGRELGVPTLARDPCEPDDGAGSSRNGACRTLDSREAEAGYWNEKDHATTTRPRGRRDIDHLADCLRVAQPSRLGVRHVRAL